MKIGVLSDFSPSVCPLILCRIHSASFFISCFNCCMFLLYSHLIFFFRMQNIFPIFLAKMLHLMDPDMTDEDGKVCHWFIRAEMNQNPYLFQLPPAVFHDRNVDDDENFERHLNVLDHVRSNDFDSFKRKLLEPQMDISYVTIAALCAYHGRMDFLLCMERNSMLRTDDRFARFAAMAGNVDILQWILDIGIDCQYGALSLYAAAAGELPVMIFLHENGVLIEKQALNMAADIGSLDIVRYLIDHPHDCPKPRCKIIAACYPTPYMCICFPPRPLTPTAIPMISFDDPLPNAVLSGEFEVMKYLWDHHAVWNATSCMRIVSRVTPEDHLGSSAESYHQIASSIYPGMLRCLRWLRNRGAPMPKFICPTLMNGCQIYACKRCPAWANTEIEARHGLALAALPLPTTMISYICEFACEDYCVNVLLRKMERPFRNTKMNVFKAASTWRNRKRMRFDSPCKK